MSTIVPKKVSVCIVGAGVSGLSAAATLIESGIKDVVILEAQGRIGGRVHTIKHEDKVLELGAQWVHGEDGNSVFQWAKENHPGVLETDRNIIHTRVPEIVFLDPQGKILDSEVVESFQDLMTKQNGLDKRGAKGSLGDFYEQNFTKLNKWGSTGWQLLDWHGRFQASVDGSADWYDVSAATYHHYEECDGNPVINWGEQGYQFLIDDLVQRVGIHRIKLNTPVTNIQYSSLTGDIAEQLQKGATITDDGAVEVRYLDSGGTCRLTADHIIFTASLAVLKEKASELFTPSLPLSHLDAIKGLSIDTVAKIYLQFSHKWWPDNISGFNFLREKNDSTDYEKNWEEFLFEFSPVHHHPTVLCAWLSGPPARAMESCDHLSVSSRCYDYLRRRLGHLYDITQPTWCYRTSWGSNPYTRGAYSFRSMISDQMGVSAEDLAEPIYIKDRPVVCFAGEATSSNFYSTVHGACDSGVREAQRLLPCLSSGEVKENLLETNGEMTSFPSSAVKDFSHHMKVTLIGSSVAVLASVAVVADLTSSVCLVVWPPLETSIHQQLARITSTSYEMSDIVSVLQKVKNCQKDNAKLSKIVAQAYLSSEDRDNFIKSCTEVMNKLQGTRLTPDKVLQSLSLYLNCLNTVTTKLASKAIYQTCCPEITNHSLTLSHLGHTEHLLSDIVIADDFIRDFRGEDILTVSPKNLNRVLLLANSLRLRLSNIPKSIAPRHTSYYDVTIVGAGVAALGAIKALNRMGVTNIRVIEGSSRVGGRVLTLYPSLSKSSPVELGAQWIHGQKGNCLYEEAMALDSRLVSQEYQEDGGGVFALPGGLRVSEAIWQECWDYFDSLEEAIAEGSVRTHANVEEVFSDGGQWKQFLSTKDRGVWPVYDALHRWISLWYVIDNACCSLKDLSLKQWPRYRFCEGERNICPAFGMSEVVRQLYANTQAVVSLNSIVKRVEYSTNVTIKRGHITRANSLHPPVRLHLGDGEVIGGGCVIVTSSLGHLKNNPHFFSPALPERISTAISSMSHSTMNKVILEYTSAWWETVIGSHTLNVVWPNNQSATRWYHDVSGFDVSYSQTPRLTAWVGGRGAVECEVLSEAEIARDCTAVLSTFLAVEVPLPLRVYRSQWRSDPLQCGTYSSPSTAFDRSGCDVSDLSEPVWAHTPRNGKFPLVTLAGEANSRHHFSTMHGAMQSGVQQGTLVAQSVVRNKKCIISSL